MIDLCLSLLNCVTFNNRDRMAVKTPEITPFVGFCRRATTEKEPWEWLSNAFGRLIRWGCLAIRASSVPTTPPWKCLRLMYFRWSLIEAKIRPYYLFDCPSLSCKLSMSHFTVITWLQRGRRSDEIQCWSKKDHFHGRKYNTILTVSEWVMRIFHPLVVKTCMFLPAVKSVVKRGTNPMPLFKDMEDSLRLTTDSGETLIGFVPWCAVLMRYCQCLEILTSSILMSQMSLTICLDSSLAF